MAASKGSLCAENKQCMSCAACLEAAHIRNKGVGLGAGTSARMFMRSWHDNKQGQENEGRLALLAMLASLVLSSSAQKASAYAQDKCVQTREVASKCKAHGWKC